MQANDTVNLDGPKTLVLSPQAIAAIIDALADKPYRISNGPINEIFNQLRPTAPGSTADGTGNANGVSGEGNVKADSDDGGNRKPAG